MSATKTKPKSTTRTRVTKQPPYNVILLNDDDHSFDYVIWMLRRLFGYTHERAVGAAKEVHKKGRVILLTTTREHAELKQEQIHAFGPDPFVEGCAGSMTAVIEPAY